MNTTHINYQEYLESYAWKALKKTKLEEQPQCECCGAPATTVHHLSYERRGRENLDDIVSICKRCHEECHHVGGYQIKNDEEILRRRFEEVREENGYNRLKPKIEERRKDDIENADSATLVRLDGRFSKDKNHVYDYGKIIKNFDADSFEIVNNLYSKDKNGVYYSYAGKVEFVDPFTFKEIEFDYYQDKNYIIKNGKILKNIDRNSFQILEIYSSLKEDYGSLYYKDIHNIYYRDNLIIGADPNSFKILDKKNNSNELYAVDKKFVFYFSGKKWLKIENSDSATFTHINEEYYKDRNYTYRYGHIDQTIGEYWTKNIFKFSIGLIFISVLFVILFPFSLLVPIYWLLFERN